MLKILEPSNSIFKLYRRILEIALSKKITNSMIKLMRKKFTDLAYIELKEYEESRHREEQERYRALTILYENPKQLKSVITKKRINFLNKFLMIQSMSKTESLVEQSMRSP